MTPTEAQSLGEQLKALVFEDQREEREALIDRLVSAASAELPSIEDFPLPELPPHPEPRSLTWRTLEIRALREYARSAVRSYAAALAGSEPKPIDMVLHCPACGMQHIDRDEGQHMAPTVTTAWRNPPHRSHLCHGCGHIWRPADVPTNGVAAVKTKGKNDSPITLPIVQRGLHT